jgi:hypothetical protein
MSFSTDIAKFAKKTNISLDEAARSIKLDLFSSVILATRVDTGRLRGNWQTTTGSSATGEIDRFEAPGTKANGTEDAQKEVMSTVQGDTVDYLTNNLPYAEVWEEQDAMVAKNMTRIKRAIKNKIRGLK